mgnify:CR=1 FL=1
MINQWTAISWVLFYGIGVHPLPGLLAESSREPIKIVCLLMLVTVSWVLRPKMTENVLSLQMLGTSILFNSVFMLHPLCFRFKKILTQEIDYLFIKRVIMAPVIEEIFYRYFFYLDFKSYKPLAYVMVSSVVFGVSHIKHDQRPRSNILMFTMTFLFGLYSTMVFLKTKNLICCIAVHSMCNLIGPPSAKRLTSAPARLLSRTPMFASPHDSTLLWLSIQN